LNKPGKKVKTGLVVSNKMQQTVVVEVQRVFSHPFFSKVVKSSKRFKAHDENQKCAIGDLVEIVETRPLSRGKCWRVSKIIGKSTVRIKDLPKTKAAKPETAAKEVAAEGGN